MVALHHIPVHPKGSDSSFFSVSLMTDIVCFWPRLWARQSPAGGASEGRNMRCQTDRQTRKIHMSLQYDDKRSKWLKVEWMSTGHTHQQGHTVSGVFTHNTTSITWQNMHPILALIPPKGKILFTHLKPLLWSEELVVSGVRRKKSEWQTDKKLLDTFRRKRWGEKSVRMRNEGGGVEPTFRTQEYHQHRCEFQTNKRFCQKRQQTK